MVDGTCGFFASTFLMRASALGALGRLPEALFGTERAIALQPPDLGLLCEVPGNRAWLLARAGCYVRVTVEVTAESICPGVTSWGRFVRGFWSGRRDSNAGPLEPDLAMRSLGRPL